MRWSDDGRLDSVAVYDEYRLAVRVMFCDMVGATFVVMCKVYA